MKHIGPPTPLRDPGDPQGPLGLVAMLVLFSLAILCALLG